ncbi:alpha/beta fold hydrolase [Rhodococcus ruber]|uniref:alpha/beta fold hydrolase n=1 Tax=Rhodococcus ruber TaxID=1830 RepID=UPI000EB693B3|nr:alpha/beta hydrolase [Rhodococcus ruber]AXY49212.1 alpha/beta hydrolase [Rhodococcus ruber]
MDEREFVIDGRSVMVRAAGDPDGSVVIYFHGTPGSRLDVSFGDAQCGDMRVRLISFDRPGYGRSDAVMRLIESAQLCSVEVPTREQGSL